MGHGQASSSTFEHTLKRISLEWTSRAGRRPHRDRSLTTDSHSPRFTAERQRRIAGMLREQGRMEVLELARRRQVSEHTVRRDLVARQEQGLLQRTHGGAVTLDTQRLGLGDRAAVLPEAKAAVGRAAAALVEPGQTVVLDAGSPPLAMARALPVRPL